MISPHESAVVMSADLRAAERQNHLASYINLAESRGGEVREFGSITAISTGIPHPEYNRVFVFEPPSHDDLTAAMDWVDVRDGPFWVTATEATSKLVTDVTTERGFAKTDRTTPGMVLELPDEISPPDSEVDVSEVSDTSSLDDFVTVFSEVFDVPSEYLRPDSSNSNSNSTGTDSRTAFVGYVNDRPVATGSLFRSDAVAGVFAIAVVEAVRGQGIGEAMTWEVLRAGRDAGCRIGALQSTEMAIPLYEKLGFETVESYYYFEPTSK